MNPRRFQFTLRRLLGAMVYMSATFALLASLLRMWRGPLGLGMIFESVLSVLGVFAICLLVGAGVGTLLGNATEGAIQGISIPSILILIVLWVIFMLVIILVVAAILLPMIEMLVDFKM
jgi:hypothetical protein